VLLALQTTREAAKAEASDPRALPWARAALQRAAKRQREGEALLFAADRDSRARAAAPLREARGAYRAINHDLEIIREAQRCSAEAVVLLPGFAPYLEVDPAPAATWEEALASAHSLRVLLAAPTDAVGAGPGGPVGKMAELTDALRDQNGLKRLRRPLEPEYRKKWINRRKQGDPTDERVMRAILATTWPTARQRKQLWPVWRDIVAALSSKPGERDSLPPWQEARAIRAERSRALRRARWSLELLRLAGAEELGGLEKALRQAERKPADERRLTVVAEELRRAWARQQSSATKDEARDKGDIR
jgi:hypothetical protein